MGINEANELPGSPTETNPLASSEEGMKLAKAAKARGKSAYSGTVAIVSVGSISYLLCCLYLCGPQNRTDPVMIEFYDQVPETVYIWPLVAFATAMLLNTLSWFFELRPARKQLCFLAIYISGVAFVYEFLAWDQLAPVTITATGRPVSIMRYVMWAHATPAMLYALSLISDFSTKRVVYVIIVDIIMIVTAIAGELMWSWQRWIWNTISCAVFPYVFYELWSMYSSAIQEAKDDRASQTSLRALRGFTVTFWTVFPIVWAVKQLEIPSIKLEEILWSCADICGKIFFSSSLLHGNFMSIEHRRLMAMRVVEEANRVKVIHELQQLVEQKEQFVALMSHELRTPLNGIIGLSNSLLMDWGFIETDTGRTVATIRNSGARLLNLINDILDAAALRKGKLVVGQNRVILQKAVSDVLELTTLLARPGVQLINRVPEDLPAVRGDTARLVQVLYNLIGNSCKFTEKGEISIEAEASGDTVTVRVHDTGIGIPEDKLESIFGAFEQVDMSTSRRYGGTGLGLNLAKQLIEAHGGVITVKSKPGQGSTFFFTLKVYKDIDAALLAANLQKSKQPPAMSALSAPSLLLRKSQETGTTSPRPEKDRRRRSGSPTHKERVHAAAELALENGTDKDGMAQGRGSVENRKMADFNPETDEIPFKKVDSTPDLMQRLSHDALPENMLRRLSMDAQMRSSFEFQRNQYHSAPQNLTPDAALNAFAGASAQLDTSHSAPGTFPATNNNVLPPRMSTDTDGVPSSDLTRTNERRDNSAAASLPEEHHEGCFTEGGLAQPSSTDADSSQAQQQQQQQDTCAPRQDNNLPHQPTPTDNQIEGQGQDQHQDQNQDQVEDQVEDDEGPGTPPPEVLRCGSWREADQRVKLAESRSQFRVLSVDDDPINQLVIQRMLSKAGFTVLQACDGKAALEMLDATVFTSTAPDLILLDVMMPGLSGYDVVRAVRERYPSLMLPVIMISANGREEHVVEGLSAGGNDYIVKPFGQRELIARVETQLRTKHFTELAAGTGGPIAPSHTTTSTTPAANGTGNTTMPSNIHSNSSVGVGFGVVGEDRDGAAIADAVRVRLTGDNLLAENTRLLELVASLEKELEQQQQQQQRKQDAVLQGFGSRQHIHEELGM